MQLTLAKMGVVNRANKLNTIFFMIFPLFYLHHNLFALGFVIGFIFDKETSSIMEKVNIVYHARRNFLEQTLFFGGGGFLSILAMPTSMIILTLYNSAKWGNLLYQSSLNRNEEII